MYDLPTRFSERRPCNLAEAVPLFLVEISQMSLHFLLPLGTRGACSHEPRMKFMLT